MAGYASEPAVMVEGVHKWYRVYASPTDRLLRVLGRSSRHLDFQALDDVSFTVPRGAALGVIGENGAGKSTLLKLVAGTTRPTAGSLEVRGVVAAILELGTAFHPEFSGRDNAILYGALMGLDRARTEERLEAIVEFAELGPFIDHPIKSYSTGMAMRLAFAVATHVDPDVLVVDEALAVGDGYFQKKCVDRILHIHERGTTILFCSHSMYLVTLFCKQVLWLDRGRLRQIGAAEEVVQAYETHLQHREKRRAESLEEPPRDGEATRVGWLTALRLPGREGEEPLEIEPGGGFQVEIEAASSRSQERYHVGMVIEAPDGRCVLGVSTTWDHEEPMSGQTAYRVVLEVPRLPLAIGTFNVHAFLLDESGLHVHDQVVAANALRVVRSEWTPSLIDVPHSWEWR